MSHHVIEASLGWATDYWAEPDEQQSFDANWAEPDEDPIDNGAHEGKLKKSDYLIYSTPTLYLLLLGTLQDLRLTKLHMLQGSLTSGMPPSTLASQ